MKYICLAILSLLILFGSCTKKIYIPVENNKVEYKERFRIDSVFLHDSIVTTLRHDTVFVEKYRYLNHNRLLHDSIFLHDSVQVPYPVVEYKEVNRLSGLQNFQLWCGRILLILLVGYFGFKLFQYRFK